MDGWEDTAPRKRTLLLKEKATFHRVFLRLNYAKQYSQCSLGHHRVGFITPNHCRKIFFVPLVFRPSSHRFPQTGLQLLIVFAIHYIPLCLLPLRRGETSPRKSYRSIRLYEKTYLWVMR